MRRAAGRARLWVAVLLAACGGTAARDERPVLALEEEAVARTAGAGGERAYALTWGGAALGWARERDDGRRWERREQVVVRRGDVVVVAELELTIDRDDGGRAVRVELARWQDGPVLRGRAVAVGGGWRIEVDGEPPLVVGEATPFELALAEAPRRGGFRGPVLLAGYGFAVAELVVEPVERGERGERGEWTATLAIGRRSLVATVRYSDDGRVREVRGADGVVARAVADVRDARPLVPLEVVGGNAIAVEGLLDGGATAPAGVWLPRASGPLPPALPGQRVTVVPDREGWLVAFDAGAPAGLPAGAGDAGAATIERLARRVADAIEDDLGATALTTGGARTARRGDCTTHALSFAALAADAGVDVRVVTGLRLDGGALVRHRWNLAWTGGRWIAVDPTYAEAPAAPLLVGLAVHGARAADLALADAVVFDALGDRAFALP